MFDRYKHYMSISHIALIVNMVHMLSVVVTNDGGVTPLFIFKHGLRFNMQTYIKSLEAVVLASVETVAIEKTYV